MLLLLLLSLSPSSTDDSPPEAITLALLPFARDLDDAAGPLDATNPQFLLQRGAGGAARQVSLHDLANNRVNPLLQVLVAPAEPTPPPVLLARSDVPWAPLVGPDAEGQLWTWLGEGEEEVLLRVGEDPGLTLQVRLHWKFH
jgi:hypothetical protein